MRTTASPLSPLVKWLNTVGAVAPGQDPTVTKCRLQSVQVAGRVEYSLQQEQSLSQAKSYRLT